MTNELRHILEGTGGATEKNLIQTALLYLRESQTASGKIEKSEFVDKKDEVKHLLLLLQCHLP
jgi:hypothetical protein